jgi:hypothetical protein
MKKISIESLSVDLGIGFDKSHFCTLLSSIKLLQLKSGSIYLQKSMNI